jgi:hypothetical protein
MDIGSIFLILGLLVLVGLFVARPLIERSAVAVSQQEHELSALMAERDQVLNALQELDFDFKLGKIPEDEYPAQRAALLQHGAEVLRKLDAYQPAPLSEAAEDRLEQAIARRRADAAAMPRNGAGSRLKVSAVAAAQEDDLEALIATRRRERTEKAAGFCSQCGAPLQQSDHFCPKCGSKQK